VCWDDWDAQQEALNTKVDRIVAAVEERPSHERRRGVKAHATCQDRMAELEKSNADLKAQAARMARKTLPPLVSAIPGPRAAVIPAAKSWTRAYWTKNCKG